MWQFMSYIWMLHNSNINPFVFLHDPAKPDSPQTESTWTLMAITLYVIYVIKLPIVHCIWSSSQTKHICNFHVETMCIHRITVLVKSGKWHIRTNSLQLDVFLASAVDSTPFKCDRVPNWVHRSSKVTIKGKVFRQISFHLSNKTHLLRLSKIETGWINGQTARFAV